MIKEKWDRSHGMCRVEVKSQDSDIHLGPVFHDGLEDTGGMRYCIHSEWLQFIPKRKSKTVGI